MERLLPLAMFLDMNPGIDPLSNPLPVRSSGARETNRAHRLWERLLPFSARSCSFRPQKRRGAAHSKTFGVRMVHGEAIALAMLLDMSPGNDPLSNPLPVRSSGARETDHCPPIVGRLSFSVRSCSFRPQKRRGAAHSKTFRQVSRGNRARARWHSFAARGDWAKAGPGPQRQAGVGRSQGTVEFQWWS